MIGDVTLKKSSSEGNLDQIDFFLEKNGPKVDKIVIMTIGNILRSDDGVGPMIFKELSLTGLYFPSILLINAELSPENYLKTILDFKPSHVIIIDAIESKLKPGSILFFKNDEIEDKLFSQSSTHMISILNLNNYLLQVNENLKILNIGIQVKSIDFGIQRIDSEVYESAILLKDYLKNKLRQLFNIS